tara:strand:- start:204 stop:413 length:210 start_codon:yes stop_codon:yes gene_type:complete
MTSKVDIKRPIVIGITWFFIALLSSEISYRSANFLYEYNEKFSYYLYELSDWIAWPASSFSIIRYKKNS